VGFGIMRGLFEKVVNHSSLTCDNLHSPNIIPAQHLEYGCSVSSCLNSLVLSFMSKKTPVQFLVHEILNKQAINIVIEVTGSIFTFVHDYCSAPFCCPANSLQLPLSIWVVVALLDFLFNFTSIYLLLVAFVQIS